MDLQAYQFRIEIFSPANGEPLAVVFTDDEPFAFGFSYSVQTRVVISEMVVGQVYRQMEIVGEAMPAAKRKFLTEFFGINPFKEGK